MDGPRVLVVDDKYYIRQLVVTALGLKGYRVLEAANGREGFDVARRERPGVVLLDLLMPGTNGYEMLDLLSACPETAAIPVVVMSAKADLCDVMSLPGVCDYLVKPFDLDSLEAVVERYAGRSPAVRPDARDPGPQPGRRDPGLPPGAREAAAADDTFPPPFS